MSNKSVAAGQLFEDNAFNFLFLTQSSYDAFSKIDYLDIWQGWRVCGERNSVDFPLPCLLDPCNL